MTRGELENQTKDEVISSALALRRQSDGQQMQLIETERALAQMTFDRSRSSNLLGAPVAMLVAWVLWGRVDHTLLLAWIPAPLVDAVQAAIDVAATEPIAWLVGPHPPNHPTLEAP